MQDGESKMTDVQIEDVIFGRHSKNDQYYKNVVIYAHSLASLSPKSHGLQNSLC